MATAKKELSMQLIHDECLKAMEHIPAGTVDMVLCDLPYGTTQNKWDTCIDLFLLWAQYKRICKPGAAIVLTAAQPFTSVLVCSNLKAFKYQWVWDKVNRCTGFLNAKKMPLRRHEDVLIFGTPKIYNPQMVVGSPYSAKRSNPKGHTESYGAHAAVDGSNEGTRYPTSVLPIVADIKTEIGLHPTQKPVALMEYLVKTYTNPGMTVLDNCMGSGTTGVACVNLDRRFIGIEQDKSYFDIAVRRIHDAKKAK